MRKLVIGLATKMDAFTNIQLSTKNWSLIGFISPYKIFGCVEYTILTKPKEVRDFYEIFYTSKINNT
jgi:hypothetical protein